MSWVSSRRCGCSLSNSVHCIIGERVDAVLHFGCRFFDVRKRKWTPFSAQQKARGGETIEKQRKEGKENQNLRHETRPFLELTRTISQKLLRRLKAESLENCSRSSAGQSPAFWVLCLSWTNFSWTHRYGRTPEPFREHSETLTWKTRERMRTPRVILILKQASSAGRLHKTGPEVGHDNYCHKSIRNFFHVRRLPLYQWVEKDRWSFKNYFRFFQLLLFVSCQRLIFFKESHTVFRSNLQVVPKIRFLTVFRFGIKSKQPRTSLYQFVCIISLHVDDWRVIRVWKLF